MELILKSNDEQSLAKIIALAEKLNILVRKQGTDSNKNAKDHLKNRILKFKANTPSSFGDAAQWEREQRTDRELPLS